MDEQMPLFYYLVGLVATVYGSVLVWLIRRLLTLEDSQAEENAAINTGIAVLKQGHDDLKEETRRADKRNEIDHENFSRKLDSVDASSQKRHDRVMSRIDEVLAAVSKNGK